MPPILKYLYEEICATYSITGTILNCLNDKNNRPDCTDFKNTTYPQLRRCYEKSIHILYIFDDNINEEESLKRFESYKNYVIKQYNKMMQDFSDINNKDNNINNKDIKENGIQLPMSINQIAEAEDWPSIINMLNIVEGIHAIKLRNLYILYRIFCFYSHGNTNQSVIREILDTDNFPMINLKILIAYIEDYYNYLICLKWPHTKDSLETK